MADQTQIGFVAPVNEVDELRRLADSNERSLAAEMRLALRAWLAQHADGEPKAAA